MDLSAIDLLFIAIAAGAVSIGISKMGIMGTIMAYKWIQAAIK